LYRAVTAAAKDANGSAGSISKRAADEAHFGTMRKEALGIPISALVEAHHYLMSGGLKISSLLTETLGFMTLYQLGEAIATGTATSFLEAIRDIGVVVHPDGWAQILTGVTPNAEYFQRANHEDTLLLGNQPSANGKFSPPSNANMKGRWKVPIVETGDTATKTAAALVNYRLRNKVIACVYGGYTEEYMERDLARYEGCLLHYSDFNEFSDVGAAFKAFDNECFNRNKASLSTALRTVGASPALASSAKDYVEAAERVIAAVGGTYQAVIVWDSLGPNAFDELVGKRLEGRVNQAKHRASINMLNDASGNSRRKGKVGNDQEVDVGNAGAPADDAADKDASPRKRRTTTKVGGDGTGRVLKTLPLAGSVNARHLFAKSADTGLPAATTTVVMPDHPKAKNKGIGPGRLLRAKLMIPDVIRHHASSAATVMRKCGENGKSKNVRVALCMTCLCGYEHDGGGRPAAKGAGIRTTPATCRESQQYHGEFTPSEKQKLTKSAKLAFDLYRNLMTSATASVVRQAEHDRLLGQKGVYYQNA
jgi:hypothetical protein